MNRDAASQNVFELHSPVQATVLTFFCGADAATLAEKKMIFSDRPARGERAPTAEGDTLQTTPLQNTPPTRHAHVLSDLIRTYKPRLLQNTPTYLTATKVSRFENDMKKSLSDAILITKEPEL